MVHEEVPAPKQLAPPDSIFFFTLYLRMPTAPVAQSRLLLACSLCALVGIMAVLIGAAPSTSGDDDLPFAPERYVCYRAPVPLQIDGKLDDEAWAAVPWTTYFRDIEGGEKPGPWLRTRAKMLWDDQYFYIGASLEEPDLWATLTQRDTVIFYDNDFEVFIDPDGDTHAYYELEINALETVWDLMLLKPYRDGGPAIDSWDIQGLKARVDLKGTLNAPQDRDEGWSVEIAIPWSVLEEAAPNGKPPVAGDQWRVNFSRVHWLLTVEDGRYRKEINAETGKPYPENNWVWSPQGVINMHYPERWGYVQFSDLVAGEAVEDFVEDPNERVKWALRRLYYRQQAHRETRGQYARTLDDLTGDIIEIEGLEFEPVMEATTRQYVIVAPGFNGKTVHIRQDGKTWID